MTFEEFYSEVEAVDRAAAILNRPYFERCWNEAHKEGQEAMRERSAVEAETAQDEYDRLGYWPTTEDPTVQGRIRALKVE